MTIDIEFGELPPPLRHQPPSTVLMPIVEALKARPGEWAKVRDGVPHGTASVYQQRLKAKGCEVKTRTAPTGRDVWARWPEDSAA